MRRLASVRHGRDRGRLGRRRSSDATGPTRLVLTRQALPPMPRTPAQVAAIARGGYVLSDSDGAPELRAHRHRLRGRAGARRRRSCWRSRAVAVRVVSMPSTSAVRRAGRSRTATACCRRACRASPSRPASRDGWWRYVGLRRRRRRHRHASATRRRPGSCSSISASPRDNVADTVRRAALTAIIPISQFSREIES